MADFFFNTWLGNEAFNSVFKNMYLTQHINDETLAEDIKKSCCMSSRS